MFKMIMPVPSPNGTNHENLYMTIPRGAQLAHDAMPPSMSRRRLARDDVQPMTDQDIDEWLQLLERLPQEDRDELKAEFSARARGEDPGNGSDPDLTGSDRRRARDRRVARDQPPAFAGRPTPGGTAVGIWDPARDQRQRRPAAALDAAPKLPTTEEIWPNALKNRVG